MLYDISPLTATQVNWDAYHQYCQEVLGISPTRGLDAARISVEEGSAYLATLDLQNQSLNQLRHGINVNNTFSHVSFSFIAKLDYNIIMDIMSFSKLKTLFYKGNQYYLAIFTGSMDDWYSVIIAGCNSFKDFHTRFIINKAMLNFEKSGFKQVWHNYTKKFLKDKTFILEKK